MPKPPNQKAYNLEQARKAKAYDILLRHHEKLKGQFADLQQRYNVLQTQHTTNQILMSQAEKVILDLRQERAQLRAQLDHLRQRKL